MKKLCTFTLILSLLLLLAACNPKGGDVEYMQKVLKEPLSIEVVSGSSTVEYLPDSAEYRILFDTLQAHWWMTAHDTPETAVDDALYVAAAPKDLKTTSDRTFVQPEDRIIRFLYGEGNLWYHAANDASEIKLIAFVLPEKAVTADNIRGFFTASETENIGTNLGLYTHYYPADLVNDFWNYIRS